jgi:hypothetical protein
MSSPFFRENHTQFRAERGEQVITASGGVVLESGAKIHQTFIPDKKPNERILLY